MHGMWNLAAVGLALIWFAMPWVLIGLAWRKWARRPAGLMDDLIDDPAFLVGQILASISCFALVPLYLSANPRAEPWLTKSVGWGLVISAASAVIAAFTLPFGLNRAKRLSFVSCVLNAVVVAFFFLSVWEVF
jgi:hypothetical protein